MPFGERGPDPHRPLEIVARLQDLLTEIDAAATDRRARNASICDSACGDRCPPMNPPSHEPRKKIRRFF